MYGLHLRRRLHSRLVLFHIGPICSNVFVFARALFWHDFAYVDLDVEVGTVSLNLINNNN